MFIGASNFSSGKNKGFTGETGSTGFTGAMVLFIKI